jgi:hypothetical protein
MGTEGRRSGRRPRGQEDVCPVCGQPVGTVIHRRKTLGAFVPVWGPGPCRNPGCPAYEEPVETAYGSGARRSHGGHTHAAGPTATGSATAPGTRAATSTAAGGGKGRTGEQGRPGRAGPGDMEGLDDQVGAARPHGGGVGPSDGQEEPPARQPGTSPEESLGGAASALLPAAACLTDPPSPGRAICWSGWHGCHGATSSPAALIVGGPSVKQVQLVLGHASAVTHAADLRPPAAVRTRPHPDRHGRRAWRPADRVRTGRPGDQTDRKSTGMIQYQAFFVSQKILSIWAM